MSEKMGAINYSKYFTEVQKQAQILIVIILKVIKMRPSTPFIARLQVYSLVFSRCCFFIHI